LELIEKHRQTCKARQQTGTLSCFHYAAYTLQLQAVTLTNKGNSLAQRLAVRAVNTGNLILFCRQFRLTTFIFSKISLNFSGYQISLIATSCIFIGHKSSQKDPLWHALP
jgi:hypothetical protein